MAKLPLISAKELIKVLPLFVVGLGQTDASRWFGDDQT